MMPTRCSIRLLLARALFGTAVVLMCAAGLSAVGFGRVCLWPRDAELGRVKQGSTLTHSVRISNYTIRSVQIEPVPACGCTIAEGTPRMLGPFTSLALPITYIVGGKQLGRLTREVSIGYTCDGRDYRLVARATFTAVR